MPVTRPKEHGDPYVMTSLAHCAEERREADRHLRNAVRRARESGASIRVIAEHSGLSTRTVQDWLKQD